MKVPSLDDHIVRVRAFLSDEGFGYDHWKATQFMSPEGARPAILLVYHTEEARDKILKKLEEQEVEILLKAASEVSDV